MRRPLPTRLFASILASVSLLASLAVPAARAENPIVTNVCTADPSTLVVGDRLYLYAGHDEAPPKHQGYVMNEWLCFSTTDMRTWTPEGSPLKPVDFKWAKADAWACSVVETGGKYYFYAPVEHGSIHGKSIGVAVSDKPTGPFVDARGSALITNDMTTDVKISWDDIDPCAFVDDDGQAYLFWGNTKCRWAKLKPNMTELDGPIQTVELPRYTEAPWVHKRNGIYYLSFATEFPEKTAYATAEKITGPWTYRGVIKELAGNCNTNHQAIVDFKGKSYFVYHNGALAADNGSFRRSVCVEPLTYDADGTIRPIHETTAGVGAPATQP